MGMYKRENDAIQHDIGATVSTIVHQIYNN